MILSRHHRERAGGFTLIELIVVVFLIGLISGFAVLSISSMGDDREIEDQLKLLQYQLTMASEESVVRGTPVGVQFEQGRYYFLIAGKSKWLELDDGRVFRPKEILNNWEFELSLSGEKLPLDSGDAENNQTGTAPHIIFYSSGEIDPFEIVIVDASRTPRYRISYGDGGVVALEAIDEG